MLNRTTPEKFIAPAKTQPKAAQPPSWLSQERKEENISPNLARFASLREASFLRFGSPNASENFKYYCLVFLSALFLSTAAGAGEFVPVTRERHWAVTPEKFELALERLNTSQKRRAGAPVILSHGFFAGSGLFDLDEDRSLARYLAEQGFDVWNLSLRGTGRSLKPLKDPPDSWTLDEMIDKDLLTVIRYVQKESGSARVVWLGYELGGLLGYGYAGKKGGLGLAGLATIGAPMTFTHREQEPLKGLLKLQESPTWKKLFLSLNGPFLGKFLVPLLPKLEALFYNRDNLDNDAKEKLLAGALVEINSGVLDQLLLSIKRGDFVSAKGDFSYRKSLGKIDTPLLLIGGEADKLAPPEAMEIVRREVGSKDRTVRIFGPKAKDSVAYGHMDLILGPKAKQEVFPVIARWLKQRGND